MLKISKVRLIVARIDVYTASGSPAPPSVPIDSSPPAAHASASVTGTNATFTKGPAAIDHSIAPGRCGGLTYATPPKGQSTMRSDVPPTCRQARACPNSCSSTIPNNDRYNAASRPHDPEIGRP